MAGGGGRRFVRLTGQPPIAVIVALQLGHLETTATQAPGLSVGLASFRHLTRCRNGLVRTNRPTDRGSAGALACPPQRSRNGVGCLQAQFSSLPSLSSSFTLCRQGPYRFHSLHAGRGHYHHHHLFQHERPCAPRRPSAGQPGPGPRVRELRQQPEPGAPDRPVRSGEP